MKKLFNQFKIILMFNFVFLIFLILICELVFIVNAKFSLISRPNLALYSQSTLTSFAMDNKRLEKLLGNDIFDKIPTINQTKIKIDEFNNEDFRGFETDFVKDSDWTYSKDFKLKSAFFTKFTIPKHKIIYRAKYVRDSDFSRFVENQDWKNKAKNFVLCAGDSYTFGEGVDQGLEYPSVLAKNLDENWKIYNRGISGDGPNDFYMRNVIDNNFLNSYNEENGYFIWIYIDAQLSRVILPSNFVDKTKNKMYEKKPDISISNNELIFNGEFKDEWRFSRKVINFLMKSEFIHFFNIEIPKLFTDDNFNLFFKLLDSSLALNSSLSAKVFKKALIVYQTDADISMITAAGLKYGFDVVNMSPLVHKRDKKFNGDLDIEIPLDGHPTSEGHWLIAKVIKNYLSKNTFAKSAI